MKMYCFLSNSAKEENDWFKKTDIKLKFSEI